jgi:hypothetical protein
MKIVATSKTGVIAVSPPIDANHTWSGSSTIINHVQVTAAPDVSADSPSNVSSRHHVQQKLGVPRAPAAPAVTSRTTGRRFLTADVAFGLFLGMCGLCSALVIIVVVFVTKAVRERQKESEEVTDVQLDVESSSSWSPRAIYI